jgi:MFS family permease
MKITARPILRGFGFRRVLIGNGIVSGLSIMLCAVFQVTTPYLFILGILLMGGFFRSLQYTSLNTVAYADIVPAKMSVASSAASMMQQLSNGLGVAVGALLLQLTQLWGGNDTPTTTDFHLSFAVAGLIALSSALVFRGLDPMAGAEVSGHHRAPVKPDAGGTR